MRTIYLVAAMITLLMLFGACSTPSGPISSSRAPGAADPGVAVQTPTVTSKPSPIFSQVADATPSGPISSSRAPGAADPGVAVQAPIATPTLGTEISRDTEEAPDEKIFADVTDVSVRGSDGAYSISVTIRSPDTGCTQYADWWEVLSEEGNLIYRLVLAHSHTEEQPFRRSGSAIEIEPEQPVIVRAHMNTSGYGGVAMRGTVEKGFEEITLESTFAAEAENQGPFPESCAF